MKVKEMFAGIFSLFVAVVLAISMQQIVSTSAGNFTGYGAMLYPLMYIIVVLFPIAVGIGLIKHALAE